MSDAFSDGARDAVREERRLRMNMLIGWVKAAKSKTLSIGAMLRLAKKEKLTERQIRDAMERATELGFLEFDKKMRLVVGSRR